MADTGTTAGSATLTELFAKARLPYSGEAGGALSGDDQRQELRGLTMVTVFSDAVQSVDDPKAEDEPDLYAILSRRIDELDREIAVQLNAVLHDEPFQSLEATWRGLFYLVNNSETSSRLKLRVLDVSRAELRADLEKAIDFDQSALFKKIYEEEYGTLGGKPYGCLVGDFSYDRSAPAIAELRKMAAVASAAHAPYIAAADPGLFDLASFEDLAKPRDLSKLFETGDMAEWTVFRQSEESRYVTLTLPRVLMRLPYDPVDNPVDGLVFKEDMGVRQQPDGTVVNPAVPPAPGEAAIDERLVQLTPRRKSYLWGNPAFILAQRITNAFALHSWTAAIRGVEGGGKVEGLPLHKFRSVNGDKAMIIPTEVAITDRREKELSDQGFMALVYCKDTDYAAFFGSQTVNKPIKYNLATANANAELSARLPYILNTSRFAHYIKVMMRNKIGTHTPKDSVQRYLTSWISDYVLDKDDAGQDLKAKYPLREGRIDVADLPGQPGSYSATVFLRPHFQLEGLTASLRLVAELPAPPA